MRDDTGRRTKLIDEYKERKRHPTKTWFGGMFAKKKVMNLAERKQAALSHDIHEDI